jgi:hypothetical protein
VFLLENTGYLPPNFWVNLWRLWPVVLVLIGVELLLAHRVPWLALVALAAVVLIVGAVGVNVGMPRSSDSGYTTTSQTDLQGASKAAVTVRFGAGGLNLGQILQPQPDQLATMTYQGPRQLAPQPRYTVSSAGVGQLEYQSNPAGGPASFPFVDGGSDAAQMDLTLSPTVPITSLNIQTGATDAHLDLSRLQLSSLQMSIGAATTWLRFPESAELTTAHISGGASTLTIEIPQGVAAQIQLRGGLSTVNVDQSRFPQVSDNLYRSPDYATATNKVDLSIETGVTTIQIS